MGSQLLFKPKLRPKFLQLNWAPGQGARGGSGVFRARLCHDIGAHQGIHGGLLQGTALSITVTLCC